METNSIFSSISLPSAFNLIALLHAEVVGLVSLVWAEAVMFAIAGLAYVIYSGIISQVNVPKKVWKAISDKIEDPSKQARVGAARKMSQRYPRSGPSQADVSFARSLGRQIDQCKLPDRGEVAVARGAQVISSMGKQGRLWEAVEVFDKLKRASEQGRVAPLTTLSYNCLLDACVQCGNMGLALKYFDEQKAKDLADTVSYNTLMAGYLAENNLQGAEDLSKEMVDRSVPPDRVTYHGFLNTRVQKADYDGAWVLVDEMRAGDAAIAPNEVTCSIMLRLLGAHSHYRDLMRVMELCDSIQKQMDEVLFASMVEACIRTNRLDLLSERKRKYTAQGGLLKLAAPTYGSMIKAYGQAHDLEHVWELWEEMFSRKVTPTAITLGCMVEALVMNHCANDAWELLQKIKKNDHLKHMLNAVIYSTILKGFSICKQPEKVVELYDEMQEQKIECSTITYNTILNAYARCGVMHRVPRLMEDMRTSQPPVEADIVTWSTIVKGYCISGDIDKAFRIMEEMQKDNNLLPNVVMFNSLLDGCARQHRLEDALRLLDEMRKVNVTPSNYTLSIVVKLLSGARRLGQAFTMVDSVSKEFGFQPNVQVWTCLIQACFFNRQAAKAFAVYDDMMKEELCRPDEKLFSALVKGCVQAGSIDDAVAVIRCAHRLPRHNLREPPSPAPGVEPRCVDEVVARLGADPSTAQNLLADLKEHRKSASHSYRSSRSCGSHDFHEDRA